MPTLPASTAFTGSGITEAEFKTAMTNMRDFLADLLGTAGTQAAAQVALQALLGAGVDARSGAYTVVAGDRGKLIDATGTWTLTLPAAATAGVGFAFAVRNSGPGIITIDPNGSELVDGLLTTTIGAGLSAILVCTGAGWISAAKSSAPYVEPTLAVGSAIYMRWDAERFQAYEANAAFPALLANNTSDGALAMWYALDGNMAAMRVAHAGTVTASMETSGSGFGGLDFLLAVNATVQETWSQTSYSTRSRNITVAKGDVVQLQARPVNGRTARVRNFRLLVATLP